MGKLGRMLSFNRKKKREASGTAAADVTSPGASASSPQPVSALLKKMQTQSQGARHSYTLSREEGKPLGVGLAMDSAAETGGRAVIYAVRDGSSASSSGLQSSCFLTAVDGQETAGLGLDEIQRLISEAVQGKDSVVLEVAIATDVPPPSTAESIIEAMLAGDGPTDEELAAASAKAAAAKAAAEVTAPGPISAAPVAAADDHSVVLRVLGSPAAATAPAGAIEAGATESAVSAAEASSPTISSAAAVMRAATAAIAIRKAVTFTGVPPTEPDSAGVQALVAMSTASPGISITYTIEKVSRPPSYHPVLRRVGCSCSLGGAFPPLSYHPG